KRHKLLFSEGPLERQLGATCKDMLRASLMDLTHPDEFSELGTAVFLDRPLSVARSAAEPDQSLILSYVAFSPSLAERRLQEAYQQVSRSEDFSQLRAYLEQLHGSQEGRASAETSPGLPLRLLR